MRVILVLGLFSGFVFGQPITRSAAGSQSRDSKLVLRSMHYLPFGDDIERPMNKAFMTQGAYDVTSLFAKRPDRLWKALEKTEASPSPMKDDHWRVRIDFGSRGVVWIDMNGEIERDNKRTRFTKRGFQEFKELVYSSIPTPDSIVSKEVNG